MKKEYPPDFLPYRIKSSISPPGTKGRYESKIFFLSLRGIIYRLFFYIKNIHGRQKVNTFLQLIISTEKEKNTQNRVLHSFTITFKFYEKILNVIEEVANSLDFSKSLSSSLKISKVIMNGIDALLGFQETQPIIGINNNFGQTANNVFKPGYYALINDNTIDKHKFWVKNNELNYGDSLEAAVPYRGDDFVLFKIGLAYKRDDEQSLPFYQEYKKIYEYIRNQVELDVKQRDNLKSRLTQLKPWKATLRKK